VAAAVIQTQKSPIVEFIKYRDITREQVNAHFYDNSRISRMTLLLCVREQQGHQACKKYGAKIPKDDFQETKPNVK